MLCSLPQSSLGTAVPTPSGTTAEQDHDHHDHVIHSGHFMISQVSESDSEDSLAPHENIMYIPPDDAAADEKKQKPSQNKGYDFSTANKQQLKTYNFTERLPIDGSLTRLFQCLKLTFSGRLSSPKWKNFKGVKLSVKDKIRLNNIIWREWHMQFLYRQRPKVCKFDTPISDDHHNKPEAIVLEGKYWKRKLEFVNAEYMRWRSFHKQHNRSSRAAGAEEQPYADDAGAEHIKRQVWCADWCGGGGDAAAQSRPLTLSIHSIFTGILWLPCNPDVSSYTSGARDHLVLSNVSDLIA